MKAEAVMDKIKRIKQEDFMLSIVGKEDRAN